jgi:hypothetical protein
MTDRRKELKEAYKNNPPPMGVYQLKDSVNGRVLVGGSMNLPGRRNSHYFQLAMGSHPNKALQADWQAHGEAAFAYEVLETVDGGKLPPEEWRAAVTALEAKWLEKLRPYDEKGYNTEKKPKVR